MAVRSRSAETVGDSRTIAVFFALSVGSLHGWRLHSFRAFPRQTRKSGRTLNIFGAPQEQTNIVFRAVLIAGAISTALAVFYPTGGDGAGGLGDFGAAGVEGAEVVGRAVGFDLAEVLADAGFVFAEVVGAAGYVGFAGFGEAAEVGADLCDALIVGETGGLALFGGAEGVDADESCGAELIGDAGVISRCDDGDVFA